MPRTKVDRKALKNAIKDACPSVSFQTCDDLGTPMTTYELHVLLDATELPALEAVCKSFRTSAYWPMCSELYCKVRSIPLIPEE